VKPASNPQDIHPHCRNLLHLQVQGRSVINLLEAENAPFAADGCGFLLFWLFSQNQNYNELLKNTFVKDRALGLYNISTGNMVIILIYLKI